MRSRSWVVLQNHAAVHGLLIWKFVGVHVGVNGSTSASVNSNYFPGDSGVWDAAAERVTCFCSFILAIINDGRLAD